MSACEAPRAPGSLWSGSVGEMSDRKTKTQEAVYNSSDQLNRSDVQHTVQIKVEAPEDQSPGVDQQDPEPLHIKEEGLWDSLEEEEQLNVIVVFPLKSEDDEEKPLISQLHQHQMEDREVPTSSSADQMKVEADGEDCGGAETSRSTDLNPHGDTSSSSVNENSEDDEDGNNYLTALSDSGSTSEDSNKDWKESRAPESGGNSVNKLFCCNKCGKIFNKTKLSIHTRVHTGEKPFKCDVCGRSFNQKSNLTTHIRVHTGEKPFKCHVCERRFNKKATLNRHMSVHTGEKPFVCDVCGQTFSQKPHLNTHTKIHTGQREFECQLCGQSFSYKITLNSHMRIHTGQKPFVCDVCGRGFTEKTTLNNHRRVHTGQKPFECDICGRKFSKKTNLNKHTRIHAVGKRA